MTQNKLTKEGIEIVNKLCNKSIAKYFLNSYMSKEDLQDMRQECYIEMLSVIKRYDPKKAKLGTYLTPRINGYIKDYIEKYNKNKYPDDELAVELLEAKILRVKNMTERQITVELDNLHITDYSVKSLLLDLSSCEDAYEVFDALFSLQNQRLSVILGYYVLNHSMKDLTTHKGLSTTSNRLYQIKKDGIEKLKQILREKRVL